MKTCILILKTFYETDEKDVIENNAFNSGIQYETFLRCYHLQTTGALLFLNYNIGQSDNFEVAATHLLKTINLLSIMPADYYCCASKYHQARMDLRESITGLE